MRLSGYAVQTDGSAGGGGVEVIPVEVPGSTHIIEGANTHIKETIEKIGDILGLSDTGKSLLPWLLAAVVAFGLYKLFTGRKKKSRGAK